MPPIHIIHFQMLALNHLSSRLLSARAAHAETQQRLQFLDQARDNFNNKYVIYLLKWINT